MALSFKGRHYQKRVILSCIRWYLSYKLSLRDLEEMMAERGVEVEDSTIHRRVLRYCPELEAEVHIAATSLAPILARKSSRSPESHSP